MYIVFKSCFSINSNAEMPAKPLFDFEDSHTVVLKILHGDDGGV